ncbi:MAG: cyclic nucleotide-binding domain-containing protein [Silicimonas sp.]|jgi:CRP-like cAMP-binding protein|nr:cyclic nucleotide-binding domain-containing protein [Silicimonas sp.]
MNGAATRQASRLIPTSQEDKFLSLFSSAHGTTQKLSASATIVSQGDKVTSVYRVVSGHVRCCAYTEDGHRRVVCFRGAGAIIGMGQPTHGTWNTSVEAVTACVVQSVARTLIDDRMPEDPEILNGVVRSLQSEIDQQEAHLLMMAVLPASERVFSFLEEFSRQRGSKGYVALPMCRRDIGEYLGLSMETVSRSFSALRDSQRIETLGAEKFRLLDPASQAPRLPDCHAA